jgi:hypothetical protein
VVVEPDSSGSDVTPDYRDGSPIMRSSRAFVGAATVVLSYPAAIAVQQLFGSGADTVIHLVTGTGFLVVAASMFDVDLPRWVNVVGAVAAGRSA